MGLKEYRRKRNFQETAEPAGNTKPPHPEELQFVVQEHHASHLHYDFRLEVAKVLKSWAIPKGPSLNPSEKRLAVQVEDHPFEYRTFEGTIPEGNYGAGTVKIWDQGTYAAEGASNVQESEHLMQKGLQEGHLNIILKGRKLKGAFSLIRMRGETSKQWLLIKKKDENASVTLTSQSSEHVAEKGKAFFKTALHEQFEGVVAKRGQNSYQVGRRSDWLKIKTHQRQEAIKGKTSLELTHLDKIYWPDEGYTKGDLIEYYRQIASFILPYLKDRPETLRRYPNGITEPSFYQKAVGKVPSWIHTELIQHEDHRVRYLCIEDERSLLYVVNLGCIDINPFNSRVQSLYYPDYLVIDLDPEKVRFDAVIEVAQAVHAVLEEWKVPNFCKTSGATGMHIYIPMRAQYTFDEVKHFAELIAHFVHQRLPDLTSLERHPDKRQEKVYVDYLQNNFAQTIVAPYAVRPRPGAPVSTPLKWSEVKRGLNPQDFNIKTVLKRFAKLGDLFKPVLGKGINLKSILKKINTKLS